MPRRKREGSVFQLSKIKRRKVLSSHSRTSFEGTAAKKIRRVRCTCCGQLERRVRNAINQSSRLDKKRRPINVADTTDKRKLKKLRFTRHATPHPKPRDASSDEKDDADASVGPKRYDTLKPAVQLKKKSPPQRKLMSHDISSSPSDASSMETLDGSDTETTPDRDIRQRKSTSDKKSVKIEEGSSDES